MTAQIKASVSALASAFACGRDVLRRALQEAGIEPVDTHRGAPLYALRDACRVWFKRGDVASMNPFERRAHWSAERQRLIAEREQGELRTLREIERALGGFIDLDKRMAATLPDMIERDAGMTPRQLEVIDRHAEKWLIERWKLVSDVCRDLNLSPHLAARILPDGYTTETPSYDDDR